MKLNTLLILSLFIIFSCKKDIKDTERDYISKTIINLNVDKNIKWVFLLPGLGCDGCIKNGEAFMRDNVSNTNILFVLTKIESFKILENKIGIKIKEHKNVFVDKNDEINIPTDNAIYPCIISVKNGKIIDYQFQSPKVSKSIYEI